MKLESKSDGIADLLSRTTELGKGAVKVGFFDTDRSYDGELNMAQLAHLQEFGAPYKNIPERPFMRDCASKNQESVSFHMGVSAGKVIDGKINGTRALEATGLVYSRMIQEEIIKFNDPSNAPSTIEIKEFDDPLIHHKAMLNSVRSKVIKRK